ncbi:MAG: FHA domain-containing protein [Pirellulales bacterium]
MQVRLKVTQGSKAGSEIKIPAPKCLIGRSDECHLRPQSEAISRRHCVIITTESEVAVRDLGSRNGTFVNDERINEEAVLLQGDILRVGPLEFEVSWSNRSPNKNGRRQTTLLLWLPVRQREAKLGQIPRNLVLWGIGLRKRTTNCAAVC